MELQKLVPLTKISSEVEPASTKTKYLPGYPRQYWFNRKEGTFSIKGKVPITLKPGTHFIIIPIAYRIFKADILGAGWNKWVEFFFFNSSFQVCSLLLSGYNVDNLMKLSDEMFYEELDFTHTILTIKPTLYPLSKKEGEKQSGVYTCSFEYTRLDDTDFNQLWKLVEEVKLWSEYTLSEKSKNHIAIHWNPPATPKAKNAS